MINLNNRYFTVKRNSETGEVDASTIFHYKQNGNFITADYAGGEIIEGHLLGTVEAEKLNFVYHHINRENNIRTGICTSKVTVNESGRVELFEEWQWTNGDFSKGESIVEEIDITAVNTESYNRFAENYHKKFNAYEIYKKHAEKFAGYLKRGESLLDLGCGSGINAKIFTEHGLIVTGVDISSGMIEIARKNLPEKTFLVDDIRTFKSEIKFDAVSAFFCIVHLNSFEAGDFLNRISQFMHHGSYLYLSFMEGNGKAEGFERTGFSKNPIYFNYYNSILIKKELEEEGFKIIDISTEDYHEQDGSITKDVFMIFRYGIK